MKSEIRIPNPERREATMRTWKDFIRHSSVVIVVSILLGGCAVGPDYKRPTVDSPAAFRRAASDTNAVFGTNSLADLGWWDVYSDPQLKAYIAEALTNSWDIKIAAARVLQAEASLRITRSQFFPNVYAGGDYYTTRASERGPTPLPVGHDPEQEYDDVYAFMPSYEVDLWGRIRRAHEAARARLLATEDAQRTVRQTLVTEVATAYLELLELDLELEIAQRTYTVRTNSLELTRSRQEGGVASMQDVYQSQVLVYTAEAAIADISRRVEQQANLLSALLGRNPGDIVRGPALVSQTMPALVPAGLPSSLLERRPDVRANEQELIAANADIGQAKAAYFPQITLTGLFGYQTVALEDLFNAGARNWQFGPAVTMPLFTGGRVRNEVKLAKARFEESLAVYQRTVQSAFREVSDGLIAHQRTREYREKQQQNTQAHRDATDLANVRYEGGVTSYLEVLYNEQELFTAELNLAQARRNELLSVIQIYRALGGGWQMPNAPVQANAR
jgi:multidrug efflux system outer membrane protein